MQKKYFKKTTLQEPGGRRHLCFYEAETEKQAEKEALDPDADYTEDKGDFEIPTEDEPEKPGEEDNAEE